MIFLFIFAVECTEKNNFKVSYSSCVGRLKNNKTREHDAFVCFVNGEK